MAKPTYLSAEMSNAERGRVNHLTTDRFHIVGVGLELTHNRDIHLFLMILNPSQPPLLASYNLIPLHLTN